jgi:hypothetical protein
VSDISFRANVFGETLDQQRNVKVFPPDRFGYDIVEDRHPVDEDELIVLPPLKDLRP